MAKSLDGSSGELGIVFQDGVDFGDGFVFEEQDLEWDHFGEFEKESECEEMMWDYEIDLMENAYIAFGMCAQIVEEHLWLVEIDELSDDEKDCAPIEEEKAEEKEDFNFDLFANITVKRGRKKIEKPKK